MNTSTITNESQEPIEVPSEVVSKSAQIVEITPNSDPLKTQGDETQHHKNADSAEKKASAQDAKKKKKKSTKSQSNAYTNHCKEVNESSAQDTTEPIGKYDNQETNTRANDEKTEDTFANKPSAVSSSKNPGTEVVRQPRAPRRVSFGGIAASSNFNDAAKNFGEEPDERTRSTRSIQTDETEEYPPAPRSPRSPGSPRSPSSPGSPKRRFSFLNSNLPFFSPISPPSPTHPKRRISFRTKDAPFLTPKSPGRRLSLLASSLKSFISIDGDERNQSFRSTGRRTAFSKSRGVEQNKNFRITKNLTKMRAERTEAFFYNHGMEIALGVLYLALNVLVGAHGAYQFTELGGWTTEDDILRVTLPIARAGGRLVTLNCAILLLTACKYLWTCIRTYVAPLVPIGFPIDNIMPKYHRYVALTVIVSGCIIHTLPQIVNYATGSISIDHEGMRIWTFGDGFATKQLLLTGTLLTIIFSTFFVTTLKAFRKTAAGFRWFWLFHMGGIATAYPLLLIHGTCRGHPVFLYFALIPLVLYLFDITMRRSNISTAEVLEWKTHEDEGQQITELIIKCPKDFEYTPGQYAELKFPPISKTEWHPFTIASAPNEEEYNETEKKLVFYIKNSGRWTEALYNYASASDLTKANKPSVIHIRGPHGAPAMNYFEYKHIVVIGSGVGVTPLLSIWKYLVAEGREMIFNPIETEKDPVFSRFIQNTALPFGDSLEDTTKSAMALNSLDGEGEEPISKLRSNCLYLEKILESMTVSMSLLVLFIVGETATFVLQLFGCKDAANWLGWTLSFIVLAAHGTTVFVSSIALGPCNYFKLFKCWLECAIIVADVIATVALSLSIRSHMEDTFGLEFELNTGPNITYFLSFGFVVVLHALRIFHIFYTTLKPPAKDVDDDDDDSTYIGSKSLTITRRSGVNSIDTNEICSIDGILINRKYSNMKFAARSLLRPIVEEGLADLFSMEFYGTREKSKDHNCSEHGLITDMMGSEAIGLDIRSSMSKHSQDEYFHSGRPSWDNVFLKAIAKAHKRNPDGGSVGVFFCGSPAIAKDLQAVAAEVTARHQFATKHLDGKPCKCKLIVHSENF